MPHWLIKSTIQRAISLLPRSHWWNELFQTYVTRSLDLGTNRFELRLDYCRQHVEHWFGFGAQAPDGFRALELGTGWFPIVPLGLYLCGASEIWTFDIAPLLKTARLKRSLQLFCDAAENGTLRARLPRALPERIERLRELLPLVVGRPVEQVLEEMKIHALVRDASNSGLPPKSIDLFVSTSVLEYIPRPVLA